MATTEENSGGGDAGLGNAIPILKVSDFDRSIQYYVDRLGFREDWRFGRFGSVSRENTSLMLSEGSQGCSSTWLWIAVGDADAFHEELVQRGADIRHPPTNYPWGSREVHVFDADRHVLRFGSEAPEQADLGPWLDEDGVLWMPDSNGNWTRSGVMGRTENIQQVGAPRAAVYRAFVDPAQLVQWLAPDGMTGRIHEFDARVGAGYEMSLFYAHDVPGVQGKTADLEDRFTATFLELDPPVRVVQRFRFHTSDPSLRGEMKMIVTLADRDDGTEVRMVFENIPPGIRPEDNEAGTASSLRKLASLLESHEGQPGSTNQ